MASNLPIAACYVKCNVADYFPGLCVFNALQEGKFPNWPNSKATFWTRASCRYRAVRAAIADKIETRSH